MTRPVALVVSIEPNGFYRGWNVHINGLKVAHKPYDGSDAEDVEREVVEAFGGLLRQTTGWAVADADEAA
jgi:hypothetical protein